MWIKCDHFNKYDYKSNNSRDFLRTSYNGVFQRSIQGRNL